jgi:CRP-like cAMP-binding protein
VLDREGAAIRFPTRFREYAYWRQQKDATEIIRLLTQGDLLRHLPPEDIGEILPLVGQRNLAPGEIVFNAGEDGDAFYIVARGKVDVVEGGRGDSHSLAELGPGQSFGEMALLSGAPRSATIRAMVGTKLLTIKREDFLRLISRDSQLAAAVRRLSHERAIRNLSADGHHPEVWARVARESLGPLSQRDSDHLLAETAKGAGLAIVFGNILDTIPGCLVIGAKFAGLSNLSVTLILGMFLGAFRKLRRAVPC